MGIGRLFVDELRNYSIFHDQEGTPYAELPIFENVEYTIASIYHVDDNLLFVWAININSRVGLFK